MTAFVLDLKDDWGQRRGQMTPTWARTRCLTDPSYEDSFHRVFVKHMSAKNFYERFRRVQSFLDWSGAFIGTMDDFLDSLRQREAERLGRPLVLIPRPFLIDADEVLC